MDWGQLLGNMARPAAQAVAARRDRTATEEKQRKQEALAAVAAQRQERLDAQNLAYQQAQIGHMGAQDQALLAPKPEVPRNIDPNSAEGIAAAIAKSQGGYHPPVQTREAGPDPRDVHAANRKYDLEHPIQEREQGPKYQILKDDKTGNYSRVRVDGPEGPLNETFTRPGAGQGGPKGGEGGQSQVLRARLLSALSEGRLADERMTPYEDKHLKKDRMDIGIVPDISAGLSTGLAGSHNILGILGQKIGERAGNMSDPEHAQYMRDARLIARAEQLMSARGGSEAMASDNAFLARGGAGASRATVEAARKTRRAMFGKLGSLVQTMTPDQLEKLNAGLEALKADDDKFDYAGTGAQLVGGGPRTSGAGTALPTSGSDLQQKRQAAEAALKSQGKTPQQILEMLGPPDGDE